MEKSQNSSDTITNSLCSVKEDKSPSCSINVNMSVASHIKVTEPDCSVINISTHSSSSKEASESLLSLLKLHISSSDYGIGCPNKPVDSTCPPTKSKDDTTNIQLVGLTKTEPAISTYLICQIKLIKGCDTFGNPM